MGGIADYSGSLVLQLPTQEVREVAFTVQAFHTYIPHIISTAAFQYMPVLVCLAEETCHSSPL